MSDADAPKTLEDPLIGVLLDARYEIERIVGVGGFGRVYRARQLNVDRAVAVKVLSVDASQQSDQVRRFENEARIISRLRHPNTLKLVDSGRTPDGRLYIATEFLSGSPLDIALRARPMDSARVLRLLRQVCSSLAEAHEAGVVHRDLKPANVFVEAVGGEEVVKVLDFGVAKLTQQATETATGTIFGTPTYMSPEQASGEPVDPRSDLYAVGVLAYEMLTGRPPFRGSTPMSVLLKHIQEQPTPLSSLVDPPLMPALEAFVMQLLAKGPDQRPESATAVVELIDELLLMASGQTLSAQTGTLGGVPQSAPTLESSDSSARIEFAHTASSPPASSDSIPVPPPSPREAPPESEEIPAYYATGQRPWLPVLLLLLSLGGALTWGLWPDEVPTVVADAATPTAQVPMPIDAAPPRVDAPAADATTPPDAVRDAALPAADVSRPRPASRCRWVTKKKKVYDEQLHIYRTEKKRVRVCR